MNSQEMREARQFAELRGVKIALAYGEKGATFKSVGAKYNVTGERIRIIVEAHKQRMEKNIKCGVKKVYWI